MKTKYLFITLIMLLGQWMHGSKSWGLARGGGGEIQYKHISGDNYRIYYKCYQTCSSTTPEATNYALCYRANSAACAPGWQTIQIYKDITAPDGKPNGQMADVGCANQTNTCTSPSSTNEMYRVWWYSGVVTLPACGDWTLSVNLVDRITNTNLINVAYPNYNHYVEAHINTLLATGQSSPFTTVSAPVYATAGNPFHFNFGVTDPNGDVLVYKLVVPLSAQADITVNCSGYSPSPLSYATPNYNNVNNPLLCNNSFTINAQNGDINFTPVATPQSAYLTYLVEKWRGGQLIGSIMLDNRIEVKAGTTPPIQVAVNPASIVGGILNGDTISICSNSKLNFCFNASSTNATATLQAGDNHFFSMNAAAITYTAQNSANVTGCVDWTPHLADTGFRYFLVSVKDMSCGIPVIQTYKIPVKVKMGTEIFADKTVVCPGAFAVLTATGGTGNNWNANPTATFSCTNCNVTNVSPTVNSLVTLTSNNANGCPNTDTMTIKVDHSNSVNATPDTIFTCDNHIFVNLSALASGPPPLKTIACGAYSPQTSTGLDNVDMMQGSNNSNSGTLYYGYNVFWGPFYQAFSTNKSQVLFRKEELVANGMKPGTIQRISLNFGTNTANVNPIYQNVKISMRCTDKTEYVGPFHTSFETGATQVYSSSTYTIHPGINEFVLNTPYDYDTSKNLVVQFCYSGVTSAVPINSTAMLPIYYVPTSYNSYISAGQIGSGNACASNLGNVRLDQRRPDMRLTFSLLPAGPFQYSWTPATGMSNPAAPNTSINVTKSKWFTVSTKGELGCVVKDSVFVYVAEKDFDVYPIQSNICEGDHVLLHATGGYSYNWFNNDFTSPTGFSCLNCDAPNAGPPIGSHDYKVIIADFFGCADTLGANVTVSAIPNTHILNNDTTINFGESMQLFASGAAHYNWQPMGSLNSNIIANPIASPRTSTLYVVTGYASGGCAIKDSVWVYVHTIDEPFIPNAFSPNGDAFNDIFFVQNLTFQRVVSFDIFDRWGNRVYQGGATNRGWDGTYKGQEMKLGTYFYNIVLELSGGKLKTYKGDLTLIR